MDSSLGSEFFGICVRNYEIFEKTSRELQPMRSITSSRDVEAEVMLMITYKGGDSGKVLFLSM